MKHTCGQCYFTMMVKDNLKARICGGAPPMVQALPGPPRIPGGPPSVQMANIRPIVSINDPACALFKEKQTISIPES